MVKIDDNDQARQGDKLAKMNHFLTHYLESDFLHA